MSVLVNKEKNELIVACRCGCDDALHIQIDTADNNSFCFMSYMNGNFYTEQNESILKILSKKLKKVWAILRCKDYYYSDIIMTKEDWTRFKEFINNVEVK